MKYLIVVDMQNDFVNGCLGSEAARMIVNKIENKIKNFDGKIIFTMDTHNDNYLETQEGMKLPIVHCIENTHGWQIIEQLEPYAADRIKKPTFGSVELAKRLCDENIQQKIDCIELVGVCTSICVISNAMLIKAFLPEVKVIVNADCCACVSEDSHNAALKAMETAQIEIVRN
jgi:nicotinamidase-related amidase